MISQASMHYPAPTTVRSKDTDLSSFAEGEGKRQPKPKQLNSTFPECDGGAALVDEDQVRSYDVLLCPPGQSPGTTNLVFANSGHVGNRRFVVFLGMNKISYDDALSKNDEEACNDVAAKIVRTICHECEPRGRFLVLTDDDGNTATAEQCPTRKKYRNLGAGDEARRIVRWALDEPPVNARPQAPRRLASSTGGGSNCRRRSSVASRRSSDDSTAYSRSSDATDVISNTTTATLSKVNLADPRFCVSDVIEKSGVFTLGRAADDPSSSATVPPASDELKRRRRSSLLRRSACDLAGGIKMACRRRSSAFAGIASLKGAAAAAALAEEDTTTVVGANNSDVLVTGTGGRGIRTTSNLGNNRFRVMIDMARKRYADAKESGNDGTCKVIVAEIVSNVRRPDADGNPGRFLGDGPDSSPSQQLREIPPELAFATVRHCLETQPGTDGATPSVAYAGPRDVTDLRRIAVEDMKKKRRGAAGTKGFSSRLRESQIFLQMDRFRSLAEGKPLDGVVSAPQTSMLEVMADRPLALSQARAA